MSVSLFLQMTNKVPIWTLCTAANFWFKYTMATNYVTTISQNYVIIKLVSISINVMQ